MRISIGVLLVALILAGTWTRLGAEWYRRIVPFYDSLSYQEQAVAIVEQARARGLLPTLAHVIQQPGNVLLVHLSIALLGPALPLSRSVLYVYLIPLHIVALLAVGWFLFRRTHSPALALAGPALYLATTPFGSLVGGVLDQRLDLATASFALLVWVAAIAWAEDPTPRRAAVMGAVLGLSVLHRPIFLPQAAFFVAVAVLFARARRGADRRAVLHSGGIATTVAALICLPWLLSNSAHLAYYYFEWNPDVGRAISLWTAAHANGESFVTAVGRGVAAVVAIAVPFSFALGGWSWRGSAWVCAACLSPLIPLVLSASSHNPYTSYPALAACALVPLAIARLPASRSGRLLARAALAAVVALALANVAGLARAVSSVDKSDRIAAERLLSTLPRISHGTRRISGFHAQGIAAESLASLARIELGLPFAAGHQAFHPADFGLTNEEAAHVDDTALGTAIDRGLANAFAGGGLLLLVDLPALDRVGLTDYAFSQRIMPRIVARALASGRVADTGIAASFEQIPVRVYEIVPTSAVASTTCGGVEEADDAGS